MTAYKTRTRGAIRKAFLEVLARKPLSQMTVSEVAAAAHVSRSTFYKHYANLSLIYSELVDEFSTGTSPMLEQIECAGRETDGAQAPLCTRLRAPGDLAPVIDDERFMGEFMPRELSLSGHDLFGLLLSVGYGMEQADAVCRFQLSGCFAAARSANVDEEGWEAIRETLDTFIRGGVQALLDAKTRR